MRIVSVNSDVTELAESSIVDSRVMGGRVDLNVPASVTRELFSTPRSQVKDVIRGSLG